ncbi:hypothetical protein AVEN_15467-1 [Araneus ventricosus]|uniref:Uncharacterized protein n=1 Tax=Araneus ventricosus TaxID=182803 RepID=A0A4Y2ECL1_ARAVE|nr:hypothetical protein AVEN_15467-1 [Araneus ventricosus]
MFVRNRTRFETVRVKIRPEVRSVRKKSNIAVRHCHYVSRSSGELPQDQTRGPGRSAKKNTQISSGRNASRSKRILTRPTACPVPRETKISLPLNTQDLLLTYRFRSDHQPGDISFIKASPTVNHSGLLYPSQRSV